MGSIQSLRALAAILVAYAHSLDTQMTFSRSFQESLFYWQNFGAFGVDIFFVISGFIICYSAAHYNGAAEGAAFLTHRFRRINPVCYIATVPILFVQIARLFLHRSFDITGAQAIKSVFLLPFFDHHQWVDTILPQAWTLSFEWFFYLLFLVTILSRARRKEIMVGLIILVLLAAGIFLNHAADYRLHFITNPIMSEFLLGAAIYGCYKRIYLSKVGSFALLIAGAGICLYEIISGYDNISEMQFVVDGSLAGRRALMWGVPAALLVAGCVFLEKDRGRSAHPRKWIVLLGDASYSIYLTNLFVFKIWEMAYIRVGFFLPPDLAIWIQLLAAVAIGVLFYRIVERPLLRKLHTISTSRAK